MSEWTSLTLGDLITLQRGFDITKSAQNAGHYPVVSSGGIASYHDDFMVEGPGVVIGRKGTLGTAFYVAGNYWPHDTTLWVKDFKGNDARFIYYLLRSIPLERLDSGSANPTLNRNYAHLIKAEAPRPSTQKKIAAVLTALDTKIDLNNRINAELEALAKTIYDYWFVQFDFPDANGRPYKTSGGKMVWNEALKREIPAGWEAITIGEGCDTILGGTPHTKNPDYWDSADIPWLSSGETASFPVVASEQKITAAGIRDSAARLLPAGTVVVSIVRHIRPSILGIPAATNQSVAGILETTQFPSSYLYAAVCREVPRWMDLRTGAQQPHINKATIDETLVIKPSMSVVTEYRKVADPLFERILVAANENLELTQLRDWLLPLLMNGQVRVA